MTRYLQRKPQTHRLCPLCNWAIPLDFQPRIDLLVSYILARSFDDKVKSDLESVQDALSTTPLVITVMTSYQHNTEVLLKALQVLAHWAEGGPSNRVYLNFYGVVEPLLDILRQHENHQQLVKQTLKILLTLVEDQGPVLAMVRAGALQVLGSFPIKQGDDKNNERDWPESVRIDIERDMLRLVIRILRSLPCGPENGGSQSLLMLPSTTSRGEGAGEQITSGVHQQVLSLLEQNLDNVRATQGQDMLALMAALSRIAGPAWYTEGRYEAVMDAIERELAIDWESVGGNPGLWSLLVRFLEKAFDASGLVKEPSLAKAFIKDDSFGTLERLMAKGGPQAVEVCLYFDDVMYDVCSLTFISLNQNDTTTQLVERIAPQPPMFFVKHSGCSLDETSTHVSATLGGEAGAEYGFGAYALGPCIPGQSLFSLSAICL